MPRKSDIKNFLLVYNRATGELEQQRDFGTNTSDAVAEYQRLERLHRTDGNYDIVLVGSDSIESVKVTHANYFRKGTQDLESFLRGVLQESGTAV